METNSQQKSSVPDMAVEPGNNSAFIIVYAGMAFSGFLMGLLAGWVIWAR